VEQQNRKAATEDGGKGDEEIERERERRKLGGGSERHYRLEGGVTET
jgi:hypothetical protein